MTEEKDLGKRLMVLCHQMRRFLDQITRDYEITGVQRACQDGAGVPEGHRERVPHPPLHGHRDFKADGEERHDREGERSRGRAP